MSISPFRDAFITYERYDLLIILLIPNRESQKAKCEFTAFILHASIFHLFDKFIFKSLERNVFTLLMSELADVYRILLFS